jgi:hypothetical protein
MKVTSVAAVLVASIVTTTAANAGASLVGVPTNVVGNPSNGSAIVTWTAPAQTPTTPPVDSYDVTCTATEINTVTVNVPGSQTSAQVLGLTNGAQYTCAVRAHSGDAVGDYSAPSAPFTPSDMKVAQFVDPSAGGTVNLKPGQDSLGTSGQFVIPPQTVSSAPAASSGGSEILTASLFGTPGQVDVTCGGNTCVGQGIEWSISDPNAIGLMLVRLIEAPSLTHGARVKTANVYKNDLLLPNCKKQVRINCVSDRDNTNAGGWRLTIRTDGKDPHGRT